MSSLAVDPSIPSQLVFNPLPGSSVVAGGSYPVSVDIRDAFGNATSSTATVALTFCTVEATPVCSAPVSRAAVSGTASLSASGPQAAGSYTVRVASTGLTAPTPAELTVTAGAPAALALISAPSTAAAGQPVSVTVEVRDQYGNPVDGAVPVTLAVTGGTGSTSSTDNTGRVTLGGTAPQTAGASSITVSSTGLTSVSQDLTVTAGRRRRLSSRPSPRR